MRRWLLWIGVMVSLQAGLVSAQEIASTWQGTFLVGSEPRRAVVQMAKTERGEPVATTLFLEYTPDFSGAVPIDSSVFAASHLKFTIGGGKGSYDGRVSADGSSIDGTWTYEGHAATLNLQRTTAETAWRIPFQYQYHLKDITFARPSPDEAKIPFSPRLAVDYMERGALAWTGERQCVACHTNGTYMVARPLLTAELGPPQSELRTFFVATLKKYLADDAAGLSAEVEPTQVVYVAAGLAIWDAQVLHRLSPETAQALRLMFKLQSATGDWPIADDNNPPLESNPYQLATVAARAVGNAPGWLEAQRGTAVEVQVNRLKQLLREQRKLQDDYDRTDLLWADAELPGLLDDQGRQKLVAMIFQHQQMDGGWSIRTFAQPEDWGKGNRAAKLRAELEFNAPPSDGHMTGLALIALRKAGVPAGDPRMRRGVEWLLTNQRSSGRWWTRSLNRDGWQFISYSGTVYPLLALSMCNALPASR